MNNLLSYCGLTDAKIRASEKDLPVQKEKKKSVIFPIIRNGISRLANNDNGNNERIN